MFWVDVTASTGQTPTHPIFKLTYYVMLYPLTIGGFEHLNIWWVENLGEKKLKVVEQWSDMSHCMDV